MERWEIVYGTLAMIFFAISSLAAKAVLKENESKEVAFFMGLINVVFYLLLFAGLNRSLLIPASVLIPVVLLSLFGYLPLLFWYKAVAAEKIGLVAPIANSSLLFTVIFSALFFAESLNAAQMIWLAF